MLSLQSWFSSQQKKKKKSATHFCRCKTKFLPQNALLTTSNFCSQLLLYFFFPAANLFAAVSLEWWQWTPVTTHAYRLAFESHYLNTTERGGGTRGSDVDEGGISCDAHLGLLWMRTIRHTTALRFSRRLCYACKLMINTDRRWTGKRRAVAQFRASLKIPHSSSGIDLLSSDGGSMRFARYAIYHCSACLRD